MPKLSSAVFRECQNPLCKFRFPDMVSNNVQIECPMCGDKANSLFSVDLEKDHREISSNKGKNEFICVFDNIRSVHNIGAMFRTMHGFGLSHAILCGITPKPTHYHFAKTSMGAENFINWTYSNNAYKLCKIYQSKGYQIISLESCQKSTDIGRESPSSISDQILLLVGNEITGIDRDILNISNQILSIPIVGINKSFNVTTAHGIALYKLLMG